MWTSVQVLAGSGDHKILSMRSGTFFSFWVISHSS
jgi:hypothetical protein